MHDEANTKRAKLDVIKDLFVKGKNGGWEMDTNKPRFKQEPTGRACHSLALEFSNPMSLSLNSSSQSYGSYRILCFYSQNLMYSFLESDKKDMPRNLRASKKTTTVISIRRGLD